MTVPALDDVIRSPERLAAFRRVRESAVDTAEAIGRLAPLAARLLRAPMAVVTLADDERQWVLGAFGVPEPWASTPELPLEWGFCVAGLTGRGARMVSDLGDDPDLAGDPAIHQLGAVSAAWAPLLDGEGLAVGVLTVIDTVPHHWDDVDQELLTFLAGSAMREMQLRARLAENLRLIELTRDAAEREALRARQLRELAETTVVLASTLALDDRLRIAVEKSRDLIGANFAAVWKRAEGSRDDVRTRFALSDAEGLTEWRARELAFPAEELYGDVLETNQAKRMSVEQLEALQALRGAEAADRSHPPLRGLLVAPIVASDGEARGVILLSDKVDGDFTSVDEAILVQLARAVSRTSERSQQYEREHEIATTLQRSFLLHELPEVPGLDLAARYLPGTIGMAVGGDWYDAIPTGDRSVVLVVGDVVGHGVRAAAVMGQLRNALRAYIHEGFRLVGVLERLDRLAESLGEGDFATVVVVEVEPATRWIRWITAGQVPPMVLGPDGSAWFVEGPVAPPLGAGLPAVFSESTAQLRPGSTLVLYTDGLVERRRQSIDEGMERLRQIAIESIAPDDGRPSAGAVAGHIVQRLTTSDRDDDIAVLVAHLPGDGHEPSEATP